MRIIQKTTFTYAHRAYFIDGLRVSHPDNYQERYNQVSWWWWWRRRRHVV